MWASLRKLPLSGAAMRLLRRLVMARRGMARCLLAFVCTGLAVTLLGCGNGGGEAENDLPAELTSQSTTGDLTCASKTRAITQTFSAQLATHFDSETLNMRMDLGVSSVPAVSEISLLLDVSKNRSVIHVGKRDANSSGLCLIQDFALPSAELLKIKILSQIGNSKPTGHDGKYRQWVVQAIPPDRPEFKNMTAHVVVDLDDQNGLRKSSLALDDVQWSRHAEITYFARDVQIAKPEAAQFEVPAAWQPCISAPIALDTAAPAVPQPLLLAAQALLGPLLPALGRGTQVRPGTSPTLVI